MTFQEGHKLSPGRELGSKNKDTLDKEARRVVFDEQVSKKWEETIDKLKPEYVADQFLGKAPDKLKIDLVVEVSKEIDDKYNDSNSSAE